MSMATAGAAALASPLSSFPLHANKNLSSSFSTISSSDLPFANRSLRSLARSRISSRRIHLLKSPKCLSVSESSVKSKNYEFYDGGEEIELRIDIGSLGVENSRDIFVDVDDTSLLIRVKSSGILQTVMEINSLFERVKSSETIWYIDEDQLVVNLKKCDPELRWPDVLESWESLRSGISQLLRGTSIYIIGDSTEINQMVAKELSVGIGYIPFDTSELLESYTGQTVDSWMNVEGADAVAQAEALILENLSTYVRAVVATIGGQHGAARRPDKWRHLHAGFSVWVSQSEAEDEAAVQEETRKHMQDETLGYTNADVVVKLAGWDSSQSRAVAQACLSALKQLLLSDKQLIGKKSLYIRLGCRGDWPNIKPPGWDPSAGVDP